MNKDCRTRFLSADMERRPRLRMLCFPHGGGGTAMFYSWSGKLPQDVQICPVHLPGREQRLKEAPFTRLGPLVQELSREVNPFCRIPSVLFGHSIGALVGFELARALQREYGIRLAGLIVAACRAPQLERNEPPIHNLDDFHFVRVLQERYGAIPDIVLRDPGLMKMFLPILRADLAVMETYACIPGEMLDCPIYAYGGWDDRAVSQGDLSLWSKQTRGSFKLRMLPGDHFFLNGTREPALRFLSEDLGEILASLTQERPQG